MSTAPSIFITGISTNVGKTICAAILVEYLQADYWKPIQSGDLHQSDSMTISSLVSNQLTIHPEEYRFQLAASPHHAAAVEGIAIDLEKLVLPHTNRPLVIEGAGGFFVPLTDRIYISDLIQYLNVPVALVVKNYLGCINHTLLSINAIKQCNLKLNYVMFNGDFDEHSKRAIQLAIPAETKVLNIPELPAIDRQTIKKISNQLSI